MQSKQLLNKKKINTTLGILSVVGGVTLMSSPLHTYAETSTQLTEQKSLVDNSIVETNNQMQETQLMIDKMQEDYNSTLDEINKIKLESDELQIKIDTRTELLSKKLVAMQTDERKGINKYVEVLLKSDGFGDFLNKVTAVNTFVNADSSIIEQQNEDLELIEKQKEKLAEKKVELNKQFQEIQIAYSELEIKKLDLETQSLQLSTQIQEAQIQEMRIQRLKELQSKSFETFVITESSFLDTELPTEIGLNAISEASNYLGGDYVWGGSNPTTSFDCSGLVQWSYNKAGISLPRTAAQMYIATQPVGFDELRAGDLVFFSYGRGISHVGIYIGNGKMLNAQSSGIKIADLNGYWNQYLVGFGRVIGS